VAPAGALAATGDVVFDPSVGDEAITVTPTVFDDVVKPGDHRTFRVRVLNQTRRAFRFETGFVDMESGPQSDGGRRFLDPGESDWGAARWMRVSPATFTLGPATNEELQLTVDVPADAGGGGRYAALLIRGVPVEGDGNLRVTSEISVLTLLQVGSKVHRDLRIDVGAPHSPRWRGGRATWTVTFRNHGDVHENVSGHLAFDGLFGSIQQRRIEPFILLPGGTHEQEFRVDLRDAPDLWRAVAHVDLGGKHDRTPSSSRVLVLPWWLLVVLAVAIALVAWRVLRRRREPAIDDEEPFDEGAEEHHFR
jgi:hypothetical protein